MEFLNNFVLPQSAEHIELLHYMLMIVLFLFIPFIGMVFGGTLISVIYKKKADHTNNENYFRLAKEAVEITTINKSVGFILGVAPIITALLIYSQILHNSKVTNLNYLGLSLIFVSVALIFIYSYKYSLSFNRIFRTISKSQLADPFVTEDIDRLSEESRRISAKAGITGIIFLFVGLWFFVTALTIPAMYNFWNVSTFLGGLFQWEVLSRFIFYLLFAVTIAGGMILFTFLEGEKTKRIKDEEYSAFVKQKIVRISFYSAIFIPLFLLINLFGLPKDSLTGPVFTYAIISLGILFLGYHFLYMLTKEVKGTIASLFFFTLIFSIAAFIISDQKAMATSTKEHSVVLSTEFDKYLADLKGEGKTVSINAAELYQVKCGACHSWDKKIVGPAHKDVIPKYVGKEAQLVAFLRNPVKVNPDYPPMPNPGLKPAEAEALAKYLIATYEEKYKNNK
jgi:cytochrome c